MRSEQAYLYKQAELYEYETTYSNILSSDDPADAKMSRHTILYLDMAEWEKLNVE